MMFLNSRVKGLLWLLPIGLLASLFSLRLPYFAKRVPWKWEESLAQKISVISENQACEGSAENAALLAKALKRIYPLYPQDRTYSISFQIVRGGPVNAFASLGGQIYVFEDLLKETESAEEWAGVMAHEIEHVRHRHILQNLFSHFFTSVLWRWLTGSDGAASGLTQYLVRMQFTKEFEREADKAAFQRLRDAKVSLKGIHRFFSRMADEPSRPVFLSDHPSHRERIASLEKYLDAPSEPLLSKAEWRRVKNYCLSPE